MRVSVIGQAAFGKAVFEALRDAGHEAVAVYGPAVDAGGRPDALAEVAVAAGVPVRETEALKSAAGEQEYQTFRPEVAVMAFVTEILPARVLQIPARGTIQYHPSLLPRHRGRSAINWAILQGDGTTGLTVFWPDRGIDTGPVLLQKEVPIGPDDTVGSLYFQKLFPLGVQALVEAVGLIADGHAPRTPQDERQASYEPPCEDANVRVDFNRPALEVYRTIRAGDPQPGAWASLDGQRVRLFDAKLIERQYGGSPGTVARLTDEGAEIVLRTGTLLARRIATDGAGKLPAAEALRRLAAGEGARLR